MLDLLEIFQPVPEPLPLLLLDATVGFGVVKDIDLVVMARAPEQLRGLFAHHIPHRAAKTFALRVVEHGELVQIGQPARTELALVGQDHRRTVVFADIRAQQRGGVEIVRHQRAAEAGFDQRLQARQIQFVPGGRAQHALAAPHQRARALVGEQLLGQVRRPGDRHRRLQRQTIEQVLDLLDLDPHAAIDPRLLHQVIELGRQVDRVDQLAIGIQQAAGAGKENDLVRLQLLHQLVGGKIRIDVEDLPAGRFAQAGDHRDGAGLQTGFDRRQIHRLDLTDQAVDVAIQILGLEHATGDRGRTRAVLLERFHQFQVGGLEHLAHDRQRFRRGDAQSVDGVLFDAGCRQLCIQLRAGAMQHDRGQPHFLQERQRRGQRVQIVAQHRAAHLDHRKALGIELRKPLEVLADFLRAGHAREQAHDGLAGLFVGLCGRGHCRVRKRKGGARRVSVQWEPLMMRWTDSA